MRSVFAYLLTVLVIFPSCKQGESKNADDWSKVPDLLSKLEDSNKLKALKFLIKHIPSHQNDTAILSTDALMHHTSLALKSASPFLLADDLGFDNFCEFVLPYRLGDEQLEDWRTAVLRSHQGLYDSLQSGTISDMQAAALLNTRLSAGFVYSAKREPEQSKNWSALMKAKTGDCYEMTNMITYGLRAFGIPVSIDYNICWGNSNGYQHRWNAMIFKDSSTPFMGLEANPGTNYSPFILIRDAEKNNTTYRRSGKVFRQTFSNNNSIPAADPVFGHDRFFRDVTSEYYHVTDLTYPGDFAKAGYFYACNFNYGDWVPIFPGRKENCCLRFEKMANRMLYLAMEIDETGMKTPLGYPTTISEQGELRVLEPDKKSLSSLVLTNLQPVEEDQLAVINKIRDWNSVEFQKAMHAIGTGEGRTKPLTGEVYHLYYWEKNWKFIASSTAENNKVTFNKVPKNALFKVTTVSPTNRERPFTITTGEQVWW